MLANSQNSSAPVGSLAKEVHLPASSLHELLNFIAAELPGWRDRQEVKEETSETNLSSMLCEHLNSAARRSDGWDILQFRTEVPDEQAKGRSIDLAPKPVNATVWVAGRRYIDFDALLPIECKRLPTPDGRKRDEREYVFSRYSSTGGIQRFKAGHHGAAHDLGAMIAYVQQEDSAFWNSKVGAWINDIVANGQPGWTASDLLSLERNDTTHRLAILRSSHTRSGGLSAIMLRHLWIEMD